MAGYIKLYRNLLENPVTSKPEYAWLWCVLLLSANHKDNKMIWNGKTIIVKEGQFITGRKELSKKSGISESKIYRALKWFENEHQIEQQTNNRYTLITILNWSKYQGNGTTNEQQIEQPVNNQRTTSEQPVNTNKNDKNDKNIFMEFVKLTPTEHDKLIKRIGQDKTDAYVERLNNYIGQIGIRKANAKYTSHYHTILNWLNMDKKKATKEDDYFRA